MEYRKVKIINELRQEIQKAVKKIDINVVRGISGVFLRRVCCVEKRKSELIIDEHCRFLIVLICSAVNIILLLFCVSLLLIN